MNRFARATFCAAVLVVPGPMAAQFAQDVVFHGFSSAHYARSDNQNHYFGGTEDGNYGSFDFFLNMLGSAGRVRFNGLMSWVQGSEVEQVSVDVAWAEYAVSEDIGVRVGRSRTPYGAYGEILDVGTLRPFLQLPQGVYGPSGIVARWYQGVGITGRKFFPSGWGLEWDLFGGSMDIGVDVAAVEIYGEGGGVDDEGSESLNELMGGHVFVNAPLAGLRFGLGGFSADIVEEPGVRHSSAIVSGEYVSATIQLRGEVAIHTETDEHTSTAYYVEGAYTIAHRVQVGARYDVLNFDFDDVVDLSAAPTSTDHEDVGFTLNYLFADQMVLKVGLHLVNGNAFARVDEVDDFITAGGILDPRTTAFTVGTQFSF